MKLSHDEILQRIRYGIPLHMQFRDGACAWWIEDRVMGLVDVPAHTAMALLSSGLLEEANDSLFGLRSNSQTWRGRQVDDGL